MNTIRISSANEATLEWLKAELSSARFSSDLHEALAKLNCNESIITKPDLSDKQENELRWQILKRYRTWLDRNFDDYNWEVVELGSKDVSSLNYIDYSYWNELSDNTRKVGQAAKNITNGRVVFDVPNDRFFSVAKDVENGTSLPPIVVVSNHDDNQGEILEGHLRATGFTLAKVAKSPLTAIWGKL